MRSGDETRGETLERDHGGWIGDKIDEKYHIKPGETDETKLFTLETASCLGNCGAAPMALIGDDTHNTIDPEQTFEILGCYKLADDVPEETTAE